MDEPRNDHGQQQARQVDACCWSRRARDLRATLSPTARLVLYALAAAADGRQDGCAWPSVATLTGQTGLGRTAAFRALAELQEAGCIERIPDGRKTATWQLTGRLNDAKQEPSNPPARGVSVREANDLQTATRTENTDRSPDGRSSVRQTDPQFASRTAQFASRTISVRQTDCHLEGHREEHIEEEPTPGASPAAPAVGSMPPEEAWYPDEAWCSQVSLRDPAFRGRFTAMREQQLAMAGLRERGFAPASAETLWAALAERWAASGDRPTAWLRHARIDARRPLADLALEIASPLLSPPREARSA